MSEHPQSNGARSSAEVLDAALEELRARKDRLLAFEAELREVRRAIAVIEKALGGGSSGKAASRNGSAAQAPGPEAREAKRARIVAALREADETLSVREIAEVTGSAAVGLDRMLAAMARDGAIIAYPTGRYGVARGGKAAALDAAGIEG